MLADDSRGIQNRAALYDPGNHAVECFLCDRDSTNNSQLK